MEADNSLTAGSRPAWRRVPALALYVAAAVARAAVPAIAAEGEAALDPQVRQLLAQMAAGSDAARPATPEGRLKVERDGYRATIPLAGKPEVVAEVRDEPVKGGAGDIPIRVYLPKVEARPDAPSKPLVVYFHGGGFTAGDLDTHDTPLRAVANRSGAVVVSVGYRLAPEHKFPAAPDDCYAATKWAAANARALGADPAKLVVAGDSAGGQLAAAVSLMARARAEFPIARQVLIYPNTDAAMETASWKEFGPKNWILGTEGMRQNYARYLRDDRDKADPLVSPLRAADHSKLPPALVITAGADPLRDEGESYARALEKAGVPVKHTRYDGMMHGFFQMGGAIDRGRDAIEQVSTFVRGGWDATK